MIDAKLLRFELESIAQKLTKRGVTLDIAFWQNIEEQRKALQVSITIMRR